MLGLTLLCLACAGDEIPGSMAALDSGGAGGASGPGGAPPGASGSGGVPPSTAGTSGAEPGVDGEAGGAAGEGGASSSGGSSGMDGSAGASGVPDRCDPPSPEGVACGFGCEWTGESKPDGYTADQWNCLCFEQDLSSHVDFSYVYTGTDGEGAPLDCGGDGERSACPDAGNSTAVFRLPADYCVRLSTPFDIWFAAELSNLQAPPCSKGCMVVNGSGTGDRARSIFAIGGNGGWIRAEVTRTSGWECPLTCD